MVRNKLARVYNPSRKISAGRKLAKNPVKKTARRMNPNKRRVVSASSVRRRVRRSNPAGSVIGMLGAAFVAGVGILGFDIVTARFMPASSSSVVRIGVKAGAAWLVSQWGAKLPVLGKFKNEIALVLLTGAVVDVLKLYAVPVVDSFTGGLLTGAPQVLALPAPAAAGEMSGDLDFYTVTAEDDDADDADDYDDEFSY